MLKQKIAAFACTAALLGCAAVPAFAAGQTEKQYVYDYAVVLDDDQYNELNDRAAEISDEYGCGVYLAAANNTADYGYSDIMECAKAMYTENNLGEGDDNSGVLLFVSTEDREYALIAYGSKGNGSFTDYAKDQMAADFTDNFKDEDWYDGFVDYLDDCESCLSSAAQGTPVDVPEATFGERVMQVMPKAAVFAAIITAIGCVVMSLRMGKVQAAVQAAEYIVPGSASLKISTQHYSHTTETRHHIEPPKSGGHGGTTVGRDGFSDKKGSF